MVAFESRTLTARWVFPVCGPPLANGTVTIRGDRIEAVEPHGARSPDEDLGNVAIIPGLVNAHTHLDLSGARGLIAPTDPEHFTDWLRGVIAYRRTRTPEQVQGDIRAGLSECLRNGTTLVGDITADGGSWDALAGANVRAVVFRELIGLALDRFGGAAYAASLERQAKPDTPECVWGVSPHAPYTVHRRGYLLVTQIARACAIHVAESPPELELIEQRSGQFVTFLQSVGAWNEEGLIPDNKFLVESPATDAHVILVHCNYLPFDFPFRLNNTVVYCPRTHAAFGHPPHPFREFLRRGVRVCLATDSLASNPDIDVLAEARFVRSRYPDFPADQLLRMVTLSGAEALDWADECGSLESGKSADLVAVPLADRDAADPHELLLGEDAGERRTMFRGEWRSGSPPTAVGGLREC